MSDFFEIPDSGMLNDAQLRAVKNGNWREPALYEPLATTALHWHARTEAMAEAFAEWHEHERLEALKLFARLNQAGETRSFPAVVLCGLRLLLGKAEANDPGV